MRVQLLAYLTNPLGTDDGGAARCRGILDELATLGVTQSADAVVGN
jgi:hypothetical protein